MRRAAKIDDNQPEIVRFLHSFPGVSVYITSSLGRGFPDLVVSYAGRNDLWEIKDGQKPKSAQKLTPAEWEFFEKWTGPVAVIRSVDDAQKRLDWLRGGEKE